MWAMGVVVLDIDPQHLLEVAAADNQPGATHPAPSRPVRLPRIRPGRQDSGVNRSCRRPTADDRAADGHPLKLPAIGRLGCRDGWWSACGWGSGMPAPSGDDVYRLYLAEVRYSGTDHVLSVTVEGRKPDPPSGASSPRWSSCSGPWESRHGLGERWTDEVHPGQSGDRWVAGGGPRCNCQQPCRDLSDPGISRSPVITVPYGANCARLPTPAGPGLP